jgi:beta-aspartyl-peptidase (threonine type)
MKMGLPIWNACREAIADVYAQQDEFASGLHIVALDARGNHAGFSTRRDLTYLYQTGEMGEPIARANTYVNEQGKAEVRSGTAE